MDYEIQAVQERQVTIGEQAFPLDSTFMVIATQNPIEQHGTYPLLEAQIDPVYDKIEKIFNVPAGTEDGGY